MSILQSRNSRIGYWSVGIKLTEGVDDGLELIEGVGLREGVEDGVLLTVIEGTELTEGAADMLGL